MATIFSDSVYDFVAEDLVKTRLSESVAEAEEPTNHKSESEAEAEESTNHKSRQNRTLCWLILLLPNPTIWFSLDYKCHRES